MASTLFTVVWGRTLWSAGFVEIDLTLVLITVSELTEQNLMVQSWSTSDLLEPVDVLQQTEPWSGDLVIWNWTTTVLHLEFCLDPFPDPMRAEVNQNHVPHVLKPFHVVLKTLQLQMEAGSQQIRRSSNIQWNGSDRSLVLLGPPSLWPLTCVCVCRAAGRSPKLWLMMELLPPAGHHLNCSFSQRNASSVNYPLRINLLDVVN